ncbi:alpha/beta fold hydrolase [Halovulum dunhuangense]|uniref:Alpha/beta fold hydrolase n=1 Tax=Halovulum dunhuangense TaxID=1505036 RepID=A0A849L3B6_9RHOB|nr:alpha/beta hydrolase [Halovulum dunhuangense]NNU80795.1 alpha/beta fold hydrolase [Halovulum dunhuangense]
MTHHATATAADGAAIHYRILGAPDAPRRFALVHSLAMTGDFWAEVAASLPADCAVLAPDCRGHGASDKPAGPYTVEQFAGDLAAVLDHAGWDRAVIGGASMGGCVALAFAAGHRDRVQGLGLFDTTAWYGETAPADWEGRGQKGATEGLASLIPFQQTRWFGDAWREDNPEKVQAAIDVFLANDPAAYLETCRMLGRCDQRAHLAGFDMKVRIAVGSEDYATPVAMAEALRDAIPGATLTVLDGKRHLTPLEVPERIAALLLELHG